MLHSSIRYSLLLGLFALTPACGPADEGNGTGGTGGAGATGGTSGGAGMAAGGTAGMPAGQCATTIVTSSDQNYQFQSSLAITLTPVKPSTELTLDWSGVTTDFLKRPVDQNKIEMIEVSLWEKTLEQFQTGLNDDTLNNPIVIADIKPTMHETSSSIFKLAVGEPLHKETITDYLSATDYPPANHLFAVMVANGTDYGKGTYMLGGFQVNPTSTNTLVKIDSNSTKVTFTAEIDSRPPTYVPAGTGAITIDWTRQLLTAAGKEFLPASITRFRVGHYTETPTELEGDKFLQLDEIASEMYEAPVNVGTKISFDKAKNIKDGTTPFAGIDDTGTWIVALNCGGCQNPAPWYLSVLKPCPASP